MRPLHKRPDGCLLLHALYDHKWNIGPGSVFCAAVMFNFQLFLDQIFTVQLFSEELLLVLLFRQQGEL